MKKLKGVASGALYILLALLFLAGAGGLLLITPHPALSEMAFIVVVAILAVVSLFARAIGQIRDAWRK